jgi:putative sigma-54 modulation protein
MHIHITARHCELDPEVRLFAQQRLEKMARFARDLNEAHLIVTAESYRYSAEITLKLKAKDVVGKEQSTEPRAAIDLLSDRLEQQLRRLKEKRVSRKRVGRSADGRAIPSATTETETETETVEGEIEEV